MLTSNSAAKMTEFVTSGKVVTAINYIVRALIALTKGEAASEAHRYTRC